MKKASVHFIFVTILLDALGIGLLIPVLPDVIRRFGTDSTFVNDYYGYFISVYALMQFVASPILGALADKFGRRPILLFSLLGAGLDYILMAFSPTLWILFLGRVISGLTGASMTVASSYMADISDDNTRSANFGLIGAGWGVGFILGPMIGGVVTKFGGSFSHQMPFLVAAALNIVNFLFGLFVLPESLPKEKRRHIELHRLNPFKSLLKVFKPSPILALIWCYFFLFLGGQVHPSVWVLYTQYKFHWTALDVGVSLTCVGVLTAIIQGGLTRVVIPKLGEHRTLIWGIWNYILGFALFALATRGWMMYAILIASGFGSLVGPAAQSLISKDTPSEEQGELQGSLMSIASVTSIIGPLMYTKLFAQFADQKSFFFFPGAPYMMAAVISLLALIMIALQKNPHLAKQE